MIIVPFAAVLPAIRAMRPPMAAIFRGAPMARLTVSVLQINQHIVIIMALQAPIVRSAAARQTMVVTLLVKPAISCTALTEQPMVNAL